MSAAKKAKSRRRSAVLYTPIALLLIIIIAIFGISVFYRVSSIEVTGAVKYTIDQILTASGINFGDNLIFVDTEAVSQNITSNLPYLNEVIIEKIAPDKIVVKVTESQPLAVISFEQSWWIIDQKARVLEKTNDNNAQSKIRINGMNPEALIIGQAIKVGESEQKKLDALINILSAFESADISTQVSTLSMSNIGDITYDYLGRFSISIGSSDNIDYKLVRISKILEQLSADDTGRIDVSNETEGRFIPD